MLDVGPWPGLELVEPVVGGHRNVVWRGRLHGDWVAVRSTRRSPASLEWELTLLDHLATHGVGVSAVIPTDSGASSADGVVVQRWIDGRIPQSEADWRAVSAELRRVHSRGGDYPQRPDCCSVRELRFRARSVDANLADVPVGVADELLSVFDEFEDVPTAVIHGDPCAANIRITADEQVVLLDWDESRVDLVWHDLSNLGTQVLADADHARAQRLSDAWEALNAWTVEPEYARERLRSLRASG